MYCNLKSHNFKTNSESVNELWRFWQQDAFDSFYCWFSHDVTKIQTKKLSILPRFYFHDALEQLKTNFHANFRFKRVLGFVIEDA